MVGKAERQGYVQDSGLETQANESGHAEEVVSDDEGTVGCEEKGEGGGLVASCFVKKVHVPPRSGIVAGENDKGTQAGASFSSEKKPFGMTPMTSYDVAIDLDRVARRIPACVQSEITKRDEQENQKTTPRGIPMAYCHLAISSISSMRTSFW